MAFRTDQPEPELWKTLTKGVEPAVDNMSVKNMVDTLEGIRDPVRLRTMSYSRNTVANGTIYVSAFFKSIL